MSRGLIPRVRAAGTRTLRTRPARARIRRVRPARARPARALPSRARMRRALPSRARMPRAWPSGVRVPRAWPNPARMRQTRTRRTWTSRAGTFLGQSSSLRTTHRQPSSLARRSCCHESDTEPAFPPSGDHRGTDDVQRAPAFYR